MKTLGKVRALQGLRLREESAPCSPKAVHSMEKRNNTQYFCDEIAPTEGSALGSFLKNEDSTGF